MRALQARERNVEHYERRAMRDEMTVMRRNAADEVDRKRVTMMGTTEKCLGDCCNIDETNEERGGEKYVTDESETMRKRQ